MMWHKNKFHHVVLYYFLAIYVKKVHLWIYTVT
jgi:hypothetical protein